MKKNQFYKNGQKAYEQKGDMLTYFYKDGKQRAKGKFIDEKMEGKWIFHRATGQLWAISHFLHNEKHGEWIRYDRKDKVEYNETFSKGKLQKK